MNEYAYLYDDPKEMGNWHWFQQTGEWVREIKDAKKAEEMAAKRTGVITQWVITYEGGSYDTIQLEVQMSLKDGSFLYGACGNPTCDLDEPVDFPSCLEIPTQIVNEGDDSWLPFGIEVAPIVGYIM